MRKPIKYRQTGGHAAPVLSAVVPCRTSDPHCFVLQLPHIPASVTKLEMLESIQKRELMERSMSCLTLSVLTLLQPHAPDDP